LSGNNCLERLENLETQGISFCQICKHPVEASKLQYIQHKLICVVSDSMPFLLDGQTYEAYDSRFVDNTFLWLTYISED